MNVLRKIALCASLSFVVSQMAHGLQVKTESFNNNFYLTPSDGLEAFLGNYANVAKNGTGTAFISFCIEENEFLNHGGVYNVVLNNAAHAGGSYTPTPGYDVISVGTAFLYERFALGTLSTVNYQDPASIYKLQEMIWWLEGEKQYGRNHFSDFLAPHYTDLTAAQVDYTGSAVRVLNITDPVTGERKQDQLVYAAPDGGATVALLGLSFGGMALIRRKFAVA